MALLLLLLHFSVAIVAPGETIQFPHPLSEEAPGVIPLRGSIVWPSEPEPRFQWAADGPKGGGTLVGKETLEPRLIVSKPGRYVVQLVVSDGRTIRNAAVTIDVFSEKPR